MADQAAANALFEQLEGANQETVEAMKRALERLMDSSSTQTEAPGEEQSAPSESAGLDPALQELTGAIGDIASPGAVEGAANPGDASEAGLSVSAGAPTTNNGPGEVDLDVPSGDAPGIDQALLDRLSAAISQDQTGAPAEVELPSDSGAFDPEQDALEQGALEEGALEQEHEASNHDTSFSHPGSTHSEPAHEFDDQLLVDSLRSIIGGDETARDDAPASSHAPSGLDALRSQLGVQRPGAPAPMGGTAHHDEAAMQEALLMATRQLEAQHAPVSTGQPAAAGYNGYNQYGQPQHQQYPHFPSGLDGTADAATLQAVQSVLQELGGGWGDVGMRPRPRRARNTSLTDKDRERIREDNRARKKRWRDTNAARNKDNDLRARIHRRAQIIFGRTDTPTKNAWIEDEYQKRREKRILREGSERGPEQGPLAGLDVHSLAGDHLSELFKESNSVLEPMHRVTAGIVPEHLVLHPLVPSPKRPEYKTEYKWRTRQKPSRRLNSAAVAYGFPPVLREVRRETN